MFRLQQTPGVSQAGPMVAVIQENIPQELKDNSDHFSKNLASHLALSEKAADKFKPDLIAWPETTAPYPFNAWFREKAQRILENGYMEEARLALDQYKAINYIALTRNTHMLVGNGSWVTKGEKDIERQNTAALIVPGKGEVKRYAKRHLVPFGEYIPFSERGTWLRKFLLNLTPLDYDYSLKPGEEWTVFEMNVGEGEKKMTYRFSSPICFEDVMPGPARAMAAVREDGRKGVDFLVNISNDGWFFKTELDLHLQSCQVRAVENRVAIARAVNTGNSGFVDSCGRLRALLGPGVVDAAGMRIDIDSRVTLYSRIGNILPIVCGIAGVLMVAWTFVRPRRGKKA
jgi:apolipoprotein N-acyltransferase